MATGTPHPALVRLEQKDGGKLVFTTINRNEQAVLTPQGTWLKKNIEKRLMNYTGRFTAGDPGSGGGVSRNANA